MTQQLLPVVTMMHGETGSRGKAAEEGARQPPRSTGVSGRVAGWLKADGRKDTGHKRKVMSHGRMSLTAAITLAMAAISPRGKAAMGTVVTLVPQVPEREARVGRIFPLTQQRTQTWQKS